MVGIGNIAKIAGLGVAVGLGYVLIKNAGGIGSAIGSSVGGGLASGFKGLSDGFSGAFDIFGGSPNTAVPIVEQTKEDDYVQRTGETYQDEETRKNHPIAQGFGDFINSNVITKEFAQRYSFKEPAQEGQLDVSNAFSYISSQSYLDRLEQNNTGRNSNYNYGGFGSATNQQTALASAIAESASKYPEYYA